MSIRVEPVAPSSSISSRGNSSLVEDPVADRVVDVVVDVRDAVDDANDFALERLGLELAGVREDAVPHLHGEVQPLGDPQRVLVVAEPPPEAFVNSSVERVLARVSERRMSGVVAEADRLDEVFVEPQRARDDARDRRGLERVRDARPVVVSAGSMKTCVLPLSRRNGFEWTMRSRSRWNGVRTGDSSSGSSRPRVSYERTASGESVRSSSSRTRAANVSATLRAVSVIAVQPKPWRGPRRGRRASL